MKEQLQQRLQELKSEYASGQKVLADLEAKQANIQSTLLRIQGAIQVLEEELDKTEAEKTPNTSPTDFNSDPVEVLTNSHG
ncbi:MAG: hypothetical protein F6K42_15920 [Leptolyngbya sp. SIO1D8]|nr:hypothetical protein [Leptolyngbya sp. SIO1D8]